MSQKFEINAELRDQIGTGVMRRLRRVEERIPAVIYGGGEKSEPISLSHQEMKLALENEAIFSHILNLKIKGKSQQVVLKNVQRHAYRPKILHIDFQRVKATEKINVTVPIHFINAEKAPGLEEGGIFSHSMTEIEVTCLPRDLPEALELDVGHLAVGDTLHLTDLKLPENVMLSVGPLSELDENQNRMIVSLHVQKAEPVSELEAEMLSAKAEETEIPSAEEESA